MVIIFVGFSEQNRRDQYYSFSLLNKINLYKILQHDKTDIDHKLSWNITLHWIQIL